MADVSVASQANVFPSRTSGYVEDARALCADLIGGGYLTRSFGKRNV